jgi:hypothetical protein
MTHFEISSEMKKLCHFYQSDYKYLCEIDANEQFAHFDLTTNDKLSEQEICFRLNKCSFPKSKELEQKSFWNNLLIWTISMTCRSLDYTSRIIKEIGQFYEIHFS